MNIYRDKLLDQNISAEELFVGTDKENWYGLLLSAGGYPIIAREGGSMYLSKKMALKIHEEDPTTKLLV